LESFILLLESLILKIITSFSRDKKKTKLKKLGLISNLQDANSKIDFMNFKMLSLC
jgi:hypothetical protein